MSYPESRDGFILKGRWAGINKFVVMLAIIE
jgi:hypothetical protein